MTNAETSQYEDNPQNEENSQNGDNPQSEENASCLAKTMKIWVYWSGLIILPVFIILPQVTDFRTIGIVAFVFTWVNFAVNWIYTKYINPDKTVIFPKVLDYLGVILSFITLPFVLLTSEDFRIKYLPIIPTSITVAFIAIRTLLGHPMTKDYTAPLPPDTDERIVELTHELHVVLTSIHIGAFSVDFLCCVIVAVFDLMPTSPWHIPVKYVIPGIFLSLPFPVVIFTWHLIFDALAKKKYGPDWQSILFPEGLPAYLESPSNDNDDDNDNVDSNQTESLTEPLLPEDRANP